MVGSIPQVIAGIYAYVCLSQHADLVPLRSPAMCAGCLLLPVGEEQGSDTACPFNSLGTSDMRSAEVSLTYFPLAALLLSCGAPQQGGSAWRAELLTPPLLSWFVKSLPFVRRHVPVSLCFIQSVGGSPHTRAHTHVDAGCKALCASCR